MGWGLVALAGILLLGQLVPAVASQRKSVGGSTHLTALYPGPLTPVTPTPQTSFEQFAAEGSSEGAWQLLIDRGGEGAVADIVLPNGLLGGHVKFGPRAQVGDAGRSQSPDGTIVTEGTRLTGRGATADLATLGDAAQTSNFTWSNDSGGVCGLEGDGTKGTFLVVIAFLNHGVQPTLVGRFPLPPDLAYQGEIGPDILACAGTRGVALVGITDMTHAGKVAELDLVSGAVKSRRQFAAVPGGFVASPDGTLVATNGRIGGVPAVSTTIVDLRTGRELLSLDGSRLVRAFAANNQSVVVSPALLGGASLLSLPRGSTLWTDGDDRQLVGWQARPGSDQIAVALATRRLDTCTRGEPGKFPQFCKLEPLQDLLIIPGRVGPPVNLGKGVGLFGYAVS